MPPKKKSKRSTARHLPIKVVKVGMTKDIAKPIGRVSTKSISSYWTSCFKSVTFDLATLNV